jgi:AraC-like DNA-binding protein
MVPSYTPFGTPAHIGGVKFRTIAPGLDRLTDNLTLPRHRHLHAYATIIVSGALEESSYAGRVRAIPGDVLIHPDLDAHANHRISSTLKLIRLPWRDRDGIGSLQHLRNLDEIVRATERDVHEATALLADALDGGLSACPGEQNDWPDRLAGDLARNPSTCLGAWADDHGLARETVSRGFTKAYGIAPEVFRAELRTKAAWFRITRESERLGAIAIETGFADQAHMSRWVHRLTGLPPLAWRHRSLIMSNGARE